MENPFKAFRNKYRLEGKQKKFKSQNEKEETLEQKAINLALRLDAVFVGAPLQKPYQGDWKKIKLLKEHMDIIYEFLDSPNELIQQSEFYEPVKEILEKVVAHNEEGLLIDDMVSDAKKVKQLYYSLRGKDYWEEKPF